MKREFLRGLGVAEDLIPAIINEHHDGLQVYRQQAEEAESLKTQVTSLQEELSNRDAQIEELKASEGTNEELKNKLKEYEEINSSYEQKFVSQQLNNEVTKLVAKDAVNTDQVLKLLDLEDIKRDKDGNFVGLEDRVTQFKEDNAHLFKAAEPEGRLGFPPRTASGKDEGITVEQFKNMSTQELYDLRANDPDTFTELNNKLLEI